MRFGRMVGRRNHTIGFWVESDNSYEMKMLDAIAQDNNLHTGETNDKMTRLHFIGYLDREEHVEPARENSSSPEVSGSVTIPLADYLALSKRQP